jgi:transposase-like protein
MISPAGRWHFRYPLGLRDIEELLFERGVVVSYETIRAGATSLARALRIAPTPRTASRARPGIWTRCS